MGPALTYRSKQRVAAIIVLVVILTVVAMVGRIMNRQLAIASDVQALTANCPTAVSAPRTPGEEQVSLACQLEEEQRKTAELTEALILLTEDLDEVLGGVASAEEVEADLEAARARLRALEAESRASR